MMRCLVKLMNAGLPSVTSMIPAPPKALSSTREEASSPSRTSAASGEIARYSNSKATTFSEAS